jgi:hypothetical protein
VNIGSMLMGMGSAPMAGGNALAGNPQAGGGGMNWGSILGALGQMGGGGGGGQQAQAGQEEKKKKLDALMMLAQILQQATATHNSTSLGGGMSGFGFGGGMR